MSMAPEAHSSVILPTPVAEVIYELAVAGKKLVDEHSGLPAAPEEQEALDELRRRLGQ